MDVERRASARLWSAPLALILVLGLALRLLPVICHGDHASLFLDADSREYHLLATNLLTGHGYSWDTQAPYTPNLYRAPGLPFLLAGVYAITGPSVLAAISVQAAVSVASVLATFFLARALTRNTGVALLAAAVQALDPVAIQYSNLLLTETFTALLILLVASCAWKYRASGRSAWLIAVGGLLGAGILLHPILLFLPMIVPAIPFFARAKRTRRQFAAALLATALALAPASAWIARNWYVGDFGGISSVTAVNLLKYKAAGVEAELRGTTREAERDRLTQECEDLLPADATRGDRFRLWERRGMEVLLANPLTYAKVHARGMVFELIGPERDHTARLLYGANVLDKDGGYNDASILAGRSEHAVFALEAVRYLIFGWQAMLLLGVTVGTLRVAWTRPALLLILLIVPIYVLALSGGPEACPRFRVLYLPILSLLTAVGARTLTTYTVSWRRGAPGQREGSKFQIPAEANSHLPAVVVR